MTLKDAVSASSTKGDDGHKDEEKQVVEEKQTEKEHIVTNRSENEQT